MRHRPGAHQRPDRQRADRSTMLRRRHVSTVCGHRRRCRLHCGILGLCLRVHDVRGGRAAVPAAWLHAVRPELRGCRLRVQPCQGVVEPPLSVAIASATKPAAAKPESAADAAALAPAALALATTHRRLRQRMRLPRDGQQCGHHLHTPRVCDPLRPDDPWHQNRVESDPENRLWQHEGPWCLAAR